MKYIIIIIIIIILVLVFASFNSVDKDMQEPQEMSQQNKTKSEPKAGNREGDLAIDFTVTDYNGNEVSLSDFRGTPVFVNFWASWCPFCVEEMPLMARMQQEFGEQYITLAVNRDEGLETAQNYTDNILNIAGTMNFVIDDGDDIYNKYGALGMPYSVFIDSEGKIKAIVRGPLTEQSLRGSINDIINN